MSGLGLIVVLLFSNLGFADQVKSKKILPPDPEKKVEVPLKDETSLRVDPHGKQGVKLTMQMVKETHDCTVCHKIENEIVTTTAKAEESCTNCHNKSPHSGVEDHLKHKVTCTSCHSFHRSGSKSGSAPAGIFKSLQTKTTAEGVVEKSKPNAMIKKDCTECHKWIKESAH